MLTLSATDAIVSGLTHATKIEAQAYTLHGPVLRALEAAARRGAHVVVELERSPFDNSHLAAENERVVEEMRAAGADARLADPVHAKWVVEDGVAYLDDKNFGAHDLILRADSVTDLASIPMVKHLALEAEGRLLKAARPGEDVIVESESFGCCNAVYSALDAIARRGVSPRLVVCERELRGNARERQVLGRLVHDGVRVRVCGNSEKLAAVGDAAWMGSANATVAFGKSDLPDWGFATYDVTIAPAVRARLQSVWATARDFEPVE
ncbi:MAG: hypothetical protein JO263_11390 [Candidatus Eremiobacteraeota bacterium]|nr:hypothetical protein [Candidatus Eremiobacteraeota bacterium]